MEKLATDLKPGDKYLVHGAPTAIVVEILRDQEPHPNQFGLPWFRYWAKTDRREGYVSFGPLAKVTLA